MSTTTEFTKTFNQDSGAHRRKGTDYRLESSEIEQYNRDGYLVLNDVLNESELETLDPWFDHFVAGKQPDMGKDFCDMSQPYGTPVEQFRLVNAVLPSKYCSLLKNNIFFQVASNVAKQLYPQGETAMDYDQFLAKKPGKDQAQFRMHQDLGYWPKTANPWTATFSLALTDSDVENGCLIVVPGTNREPELRRHQPISFSAPEGVAEDREQSHTLVIESKPTDQPTYLPVKRGSITIHDERIVHGSAGNTSDIWRKTYVMAFRPVETIREERDMGFTHSHNDQVNWDTFIK